MRVAAASKELFRQRDQGNPLAYRFIGVRINGTSSRRPNHGPAKGLLYANGSRPGEHPLMAGLTLAAKGVVSGVLRQQSTIIRLRSEVSVCRKGDHREVV